MNIEGKRVLVIGLGISGVASIKALIELGASVLVADSKAQEELGDVISSLSGLEIEYRLGGEDVELEDIHFILKSPGVPYDIPMLTEARASGIDVMTDIELAYRIASAKFVAITGTNGKTTTTTLIGEIFKRGGLKSYVVGNIGVGILSKLEELRDSEAVFILEASSFQLEDTRDFRPDVSLITNITPDHINWHKTFENYVDSKKKIYRNQREGDFVILNYEDCLLRDSKYEVESDLIFFSSKRELDSGVYVKDGRIWLSRGGDRTAIIDVSEIKVPGTHNLENVLAAIGVSVAYGIDLDVIKDSISDFEGVEHRLEFVKSVGGIRFYNDSKGTNPDASIKAVRAIDKPITLIAGGMDKGGEFDEFVDSFKGKVENIVLLGETSNKIETICRKKGYDKVFQASNMLEAVEIAYRESKDGYNILLSPACASWDMYESYEVRGREFKGAVNRLGEV